MGQGGNIALFNATKSNLVSSNQNSYQMNSWSFPATIPAGTVANIYVEWDQNITVTTGDDAGNVTYTVEGTGDSFTIQARVISGNFDISVLFSGMSAEGNPQGSKFDLGWAWNSVMNFVLGGQHGNYYTNNSPFNNWMSANLAALGNKTLKQLCLPGAHDSGMSSIIYSTVGSTAGNTQTQQNTYAGQLSLGIRFFDLRPVISHGQYYTGHYSQVGPSWQGSCGESIAQIISDINNFTASNKELIILDLSHDYDTDSGNSNYPPFTQEQWMTLLAQLQGINHLYKNSNPNVDLSSLTLNDFIANGPAVVVIIEGTNTVNLGNLAGQGFYTSANLNIYNNYANSDDWNAMATDQITKMKQNVPPSYFLLSWTLTLQGLNNVNPLANTILENAAICNPQLAASLLPNCNSTCYPNIILIDDVVSTNVPAVSLALSTMY